MTTINVFLVDDEPLLREFAQSTLAELKHVSASGASPVIHLSLFSDGAEAIEALDQEVPDVVITDLNMPTSGVQVVQAAKGKGVKVIILMTGNTPQNIPSLGVPVVQKPYNPPDLVRVFISNLEKAGLLK